VTDNLFAQKTISTESIGISFEPTDGSALNGELSFGSVDTTKVRNKTTLVVVHTYNIWIQSLQITGEVTFTPITHTSPASQYWGIDQTVSYGASGTQLLKSSGIVDTGTTLLLIATDAFQAYQKATGATLDQSVCFR